MKHHSCCVTIHCPGGVSEKDVVTFFSSTQTRSHVPSREEASKALALFRRCFASGNRKTSRSQHVTFRVVCPWGTVQFVAGNGERIVCVSLDDDGHQPYSWRVSCKNLGLGFFRLMVAVFTLCHGCFITLATVSIVQEHWTEDEFIATTLLTLRQGLEVTVFLLVVLDSTCGPRLFLDSSHSTARPTPAPCATKTCFSKALGGTSRKSSLLATASGSHDNNNDNDDKLDAGREAVQLLGSPRQAWLVRAGLYWFLASSFSPSYSLLRLRLRLTSDQGSPLQGHSHFAEWFIVTTGCVLLASGVLSASVHISQRLQATAGFRRTTSRVDRTARATAASTTTEPGTHVGTGNATESPAALDEIAAADTVSVASRIRSLVDATDGTTSLAAPRQTRGSLISRHGRGSERHRPAALVSSRVTGARCASCLLRMTTYLAVFLPMLVTMSVVAVFVVLVLTTSSDLLRHLESASSFPGRWRSVIQIHSLLPSDMVIFYSQTLRYSSTLALCACVLIRITTVIFTKVLRRRGTLTSLGVKNLFLYTCCISSLWTPDVFKLLRQIYSKFKIHTKGNDFAEALFSSWPNLQAVFAAASTTAILVPLLCSLGMYCLKRRRLLRESRKYAEFLACPKLNRLRAVTVYVLLHLVQASAVTLSLCALLLTFLAVPVPWVSVRASYSRADFQPLAAAVRNVSLQLEQLAVAAETLVTLPVCAEDKMATLSGEIGLSRNTLMRLSVNDIQAFCLQRECQNSGVEKTRGRHQYYGSRLSPINNDKHFLPGKNNRDRNLYYHHRQHIIRSPFCEKFCATKAYFRGFLSFNSSVHELLAKEVKGNSMYETFHLKSLILDEKLALLSKLDSRRSLGSTIVALEDNNRSDFSFADERIADANEQHRGEISGGQSVNRTSDHSSSGEHFRLTDHPESGPTSEEYIPKPLRHVQHYKPSSNFHMSCMQTLCTLRAASQAGLAAPILGIAFQAVLLAVQALLVTLRMVMKVEELAVVFDDLKVRVDALLLQLERGVEEKVVYLSVDNYSLIYLAYPALITGCVGMLLGFWDRKGSLGDRRHRCRAMVAVVLPLLALNTLGFIVTLAWTLLIDSVSSLITLADVTSSPHFGARFLLAAYVCGASSCSLLLMLLAWSNRQQGSGHDDSAADQHSPKPRHDQTHLQQQQPPQIFLGNPRRAIISRCISHGRNSSGSSIETTNNSSSHRLPVSGDDPDVGENGCRLPNQNNSYELIGPSSIRASPLALTATYLTTSSQTNPCCTASEDDVQKRVRALKSVETEPTKKACVAAESKENVLHNDVLGSMKPSPVCYPNHVKQPEPVTNLSKNENKDLSYDAELGSGKPKPVSYRKCVKLSEPVTDLSKNEKNVLSHNESDGLCSGKYSSPRPAPLPPPLSSSSPGTDSKDRDEAQGCFQQAMRFGASPEFACKRRKTQHQESSSSARATNPKTGNNNGDALSGASRARNIGEAFCGCGGCCVRERASDVGSSSTCNDSSGSWLLSIVLAVTAIGLMASTFWVPVFSLSVALRRQFDTLLTQLEQNSVAVVTGRHVLMSEGRGSCDVMEALGRKVVERYLGTLQELRLQRLLSELRSLRAKAQQDARVFHPIIVVPCLTVTLVSLLLLLYGALVPKVSGFQSATAQPPWCLGPKAAARGLRRLTLMSLAWLLHTSLALVGPAASVVAPAAVVEVSVGLGAGFGLAVAAHLALLLASLELRLSAFAPLT